MGALHLPAMFLFQDAVSMANDVHWIMICELVLPIVYSKVNSLIKLADAKAQPLLAQATPLVAKGKEIAGHVNDIVADLKPKIASVTSDLEPKIKAVTSDLQPKIASVTSDVQHISSVVRSKVDEAGLTFTKVNQTVAGFTETAKDANVKAKDQVQRVNGMVSEALTTTQQVSKQIQHGIKVPVEKIASWVTAAKIGIENLAEKVPFLNQTVGSKAPGGRGPVHAGTRPGPVPVAPAGARVVRSAEDVARDTPPVR